MIEFIGYKFHQGGPAVMSAITLTLVLSLVIILERVIRYWFTYNLANTSGFLAKIEKYIMQDQAEKAIRICKDSKPKMVPRVLEKGLNRANASEEEINNAIETETITVMSEVTKRVAFLGTTANVATLLGLLGTIFGLMKSFAAAANATGAEKQRALAEGISEALTATSYGLSTALLCLLAHGILSMKQTAIANDVNQSAAKLIDLLISRKIHSENK